MSLPLLIPPKNTTQESKGSWQHSWIDVREVLTVHFISQEFANFESEMEAVGEACLWRIYESEAPKENEKKFYLK